MKKALLFAITLTLLAACERNRYEYARPYPTDQKGGEGSQGQIEYTFKPNVNVPPPASK